MRPPEYAALLLALLVSACGDSGAPNPSPKALQTVSGNGQRAAANRPLVAPLRIRVTGSDDQPLAGATVTWSVTEGQAILDPAHGTTNSAGDAETRVTLGGTLGSIVVTAAVNGLTPVTFSITALDPSAFISVSAGRGFTCALTAGGPAYCWGLNTHGALGDGTTTDRSTPVPVLGGLEFVTISAGDALACGLTADGDAYCWGDNRIGQLGDGTMVDRSNPVPVAGNLSFAAISAGGGKICGVTTSGDLYCTGYLYNGVQNLQLVPVHIASDVDFTTVTPSTEVACALTAGGTAYCLGRGTYGQLGDGTDITRPTLGPVAGDLTFTSITSGWGGWNHVCGLNSSGAAHCWGFNYSGQVGDGTTEARFVPVPVAGGVIFNQIEAGSGHTCGLTAEGAAYCWGSNNNAWGPSGGALGDGTTTDRYTPVPVSGGLRFTAISAGGNHTCGITTVGEAYCWGEGQVTPALVERLPRLINP